MVLTGLIEAILFTLKDNNESLNMLKQKFSNNQKLN